MDFKYKMSLKELRKRTSKTRYRKIEFLKREDKEVQELSNDDLMVLCHLTRAAYEIENIHFSLENVKNHQILTFLNKQSAKNDEKAILAKRMFLSQKSNFSPDMEGNKTALFDGVNKTLGLGYFPEDLTVEKFHEILSQMIDNSEVQAVQEILNQRSIVKWDGDKLKAIDFVDAFRDEFKIVANELEKAKQYSTDEKFNNYLDLQIKALEKADPMLDAYADKAWAELDENTKFEFTITREKYDERLTKTIFDNEELTQKLQDAGVKIHSKDSLGARVGLVNKEGTELLNKLKGLVDISAKFMPYKELYENKKASKVKQIAVDVDLIAIFGDEGAYQASFVTAQNLPNSDKLAFSIGGGNRNVYHRQVRKSGNKKNYRKLIAEEFWKFYNPEADHWAVICHENTHSLGPNSNTLGKYSSILEEYKADMGMYAFLDEFIGEKCFTDFETKQMMVTGLFRNFMKGKPVLAQAHKTRSVMICNRMLTEKAITLDENDKMHFDFDKIKSLTKTMLAEVVKLQIDGDVKQAEKYVQKWFVWSETIEKISNVIRSYNKFLNGYVDDSLAQEFLDPNFENTLN